MILIIWTDIADQPSNKEFPRMHEARVVRMNNRLKVEETIQIKGIAARDSGDEAILNDWKKLFETVKGFSKDGGKPLCFFSRAGQRNRFIYMNNVLQKQGFFRSEIEARYAVLGELLSKDGVRPGIDEGIPQMIELIQKHGVESLIMRKSKSEAKTKAAAAKPAQKAADTSLAWEKLQKRLENH